MDGYKICETKLCRDMFPGNMHACLRDTGRLAGGYFASGELDEGELDQLKRLAVTLAISPAEAERKWIEAVAYGRKDPIKVGSEQPPKWSFSPTTAIPKSFSPPEKSTANTDKSGIDDEDDLPEIVPWEVGKERPKPKPDRRTVTERTDELLEQLRPAFSALLKQYPEARLWPFASAMMNVIQHGQTAAHDDTPYVKRVESVQWSIYNAGAKAAVYLRNIMEKQRPSCRSSGQGRRRDDPPRHGSFQARPDPPPPFMDRQKRDSRDNCGRASAPRRSSITRLVPAFFFVGIL